MIIHKYCYIVISIICYYGLWKNIMATIKRGAVKGGKGRRSVNAEEAAKEMSQLFAALRPAVVVSLIDGVVCVIDDGVVGASGDYACQWVAVAELADNMDLRGCVILYRGGSGLWERLIVNEDKTITETQTLGRGMAPDEAVRHLKGPEA
jgi:hypothetical protein